MTLEVHQPAPSDLLARKDYAGAVAAADILPEAFRRKPANILVVMEVADALELRPFMVMQEMSVISGRPSFSAKFMRALVRRAGHKLRETFADGAARCVIIRADDPEFEHVAVWDEAKARQHDYWGKGHWKKNPELMLKNRAVSECVREACPEVLGGVSYSTDEVQDFAPTVSQVAAPTAESQPRGVAGALANARSKRQPEPEAPAPAGDGITEAQSSKLWVALRGAQLEDRDDALAAIGNIIDRPIASTKDLTRDEASRVIDALEADQQWSNADPETGEVFDSEIVTDEADR